MLGHIAFQSTSLLGLGSSLSIAAAASDDLVSSRYHLPETDYFARTRGAMPLHTLAGYAEAERRAELVGSNMGTILWTPLSGPHEYSPYGAGLVERMREDQSAANKFAGRWERALVISPGTAILGLGQAPSTGGVILAEAAAPIMMGKAKYFRWTAGVSTDYQCVQTHLSQDQLAALKKMEPRAAANQARIWQAEKFAEVVRALAGNYGFINIEDARGKDLPIILGALECVKGQCAVWSDDQQGTGVITAAAMLAWAEQTGRKMEDVRVVLFGAGAGAMGVYDELINHGVQDENILTTDSRGVLHEGRTDINGDPYKQRMRVGIPEGMTIEKFAKGADALINLGVKETLTDDLAWTEDITRSLAKNPFFGPMTNPDPGITPAMLRDVRKDAFFGSGNQMYPNTVNNFTAFGYIGAGALMAMAGAVTAEMTVAAARGILEVAKMGPPEWLRDRLPDSQREYGREWLVPHPEDIRLINAEAGAVARAAARPSARSGVVAIGFKDHPTRADLAEFDARIDAAVAVRTSFVEYMRSSADERGREYLRLKYADRYAPFTMPGQKKPVYQVSPIIPFDEFERHARAMGVKEIRWKDFLSGDNQLKGTALTDILKMLVTKIKEDAQANEAVAVAWQRELEIIIQIAQIYPALGAALALRRSRVANYDSKGATVFHRPAVIKVILQEMPEARKGIYEFEGVPSLR